MMLKAPKASGNKTLDATSKYSEHITILLFGISLASTDTRPSVSIVVCKKRK